MNQILDVKSWKAERDLKPQFEVVAKINGTISMVTRLSDGEWFEINKAYPSLLHDFFKIFFFHNDLKTVEGEYYKDDKVVYTLKCDINDLKESNGMISDNLSEKEKIMAYSA